MASETKSITRTVNTQLASVQGGYWLSFLAIGGFSVVLLQSKNFTASEIGILLALQSLASIIAQPLLSGYADRHRRLPLKYFVVAMLLISILVFGAMQFVPHLMLPAVLIFITMGMTYTCVPAFVNAIAMQLINSGVKVNYGLTRGLGSLAFASMGTLLGKLIDLSGAGVIVPFFAVSALLTIASVLWLRKPTVPEPSKEDIAAETSADRSSALAPENLWTFLRKNKVFTGFCISSAILFTSHACINNFLPDIVTKLGGSVADQGITRSIAAAVEFPIMFLYLFLSRRFTGNKLLILSAFSFFLKALTTLLAPSVAWLYVIQLLQMPAFGLYTPSAVVFSDTSVSERDRVRAQSLAMASTFGIGNVVGSLGGGFVIDTLGLYPMLILSSVAGFIGFVIMFVVLFERPSKAKVRVD